MLKQSDVLLVPLALSSELSVVARYNMHCNGLRSVSYRDFES